MANLVRRDASSTSGGELTSGTQTIPGAKTFTGAVTLSGGQIGKTDGVAVAAGSVGQVITSGASTVTAIAVNAFADITSITLTPGVWIITANIAVLAFSTTGATISSAALSTFSANTVTDQVNAVNQLNGTAPTAGNQDTNFSLVWTKNVSSSTPIYAKIQTTASSGTTAGRACITAFRIA